jgi:hypothetical protein
MSGGWSRLTREAVHGGNGDGCVPIMFAALAFPFVMYGLATAAEWIGDRYGGVAGIAVFAAPIWVSLLIGTFAAVRAKIGEGQ